MRMIEELQLPVVPLSESEVMYAAQQIADGKKGSKIVLGMYSPIKLSASFAGGKVNKLTGELYPEVHALKCIEQQVATGSAYENHQTVKDRNSSDAWLQKQADFAQKVANGEASERGPRMKEWIIPDIIGINSADHKVLAYWPNRQNKPNVRYYISIDREDYRECSKQEIAEYKSPADAAAFLAPFSDTPADDAAASSVDVGFRTALLDHIYKLNSVGNTFIMKKSDTNDGINRKAGEKRFTCTVLNANQETIDEQYFTEETEADAFIWEQLKLGNSVIKNDRVRHEKHQYSADLYNSSVIDLPEVEVTM